MKNTCLLWSLLPTCSYINGLCIREMEFQQSDKHTALRSQNLCKHNRRGKQTLHFFLMWLGKNWQLHEVWSTGMSSCVHTPYVTKRDVFWLHSLSQKIWVRCFSAQPEKESAYWSNLLESFHRPKEDICSWFCLGTWGFFTQECRNPISASQIDSLRERWNNKQGQTEEAPGNGMYQVGPLQTSFESITMKRNGRLLDS